MPPVEHRPFHFVLTSDVDTLSITLLIIKTLRGCLGNNIFIQILSY